MIDIITMIAGLKDFAGKTGGEYTERPGVEYTVHEVSYSNGVVTVHVSDEAFVSLVLLSTTVETGDGGKLGCTIGLFTPDKYFDVYPTAKKIEIGISNPPMQVTFDADKGHVENIEQVVQASRPDRVHRASIVRYPR